MDKTKSGLAHSPALESCATRHASYSPISVRGNASFIPLTEREYWICAHNTPKLAHVGIAAN